MKKSKMRLARKRGRKLYVMSFTFSLEQIAWLNALDNASELMRKVVSDLMLAEKGAGVGIAPLRTQLEVLEVEVRKEEKERDEILSGDDTWDAWKMENNEYVLDADRNLIPKNAGNVRVQSVLEIYKAHNKKIDELQKKIEEIKAKILSSEKAV